MICPRCGFPFKHTPCRLCGQTEWEKCELDRYDAEQPGRLEFTVILRGEHPNPAIHNEDSLFCYARTEELQPRHFFFFPDHTHSSLLEFLQSIQDVSGWSLMVNGRVRPFSQELWLPLLELAGI